MMRKLLPYEYDLIDALGVSKEEYLDFVAQQHIYEDTKEGTALDVRNEVVAIVLAVIGILFQAASIIFAPRPQAPQLRQQQQQQQTGVAQTRDQVLSPRLGFNGSQELAAYGDTVPLVYTNTAQNSNGGVRLSTLLLWSAILSFGNNQFMRLMTTLGAANIARIDPERTALGQFPAKDLVLSNVWQYYNPDGPTRYNNLVRGDANDPTITFSIDTTAKLNGLPSAEEGFSQCFSPTTNSAVGVVGFIPVNAAVLILNSTGNQERAPVPIGFGAFSPSPLFYWGNDENRPTVPVGSRWSLYIQNTAAQLASTDTLGIAIQDALRAASSQIDNGAIFKAGSALFRVASASYGSSANGIEEGNLWATLECIRAGIMPRARYDLTHWLQQFEQINALSAQISSNNNTIAALQQQNASDRAILAKNQAETIVEVTLPRGGQRSVKRFRELTTQERNNYSAAINSRDAQIATLQNSNTALQAQINTLTNQGDPVLRFHTKGLARVEEAAYASVTKCNVLDLALRYQSYRRISGRSNVYGSNQVNWGHSPSDNGAKARTSMFALWYRFDNSGDYARLPYIFCCRGFNEQNAFVYLKLISRNTARFIEIKLEAVVETFAEIRTFRTRGYCYLNAAAPLVALDSSLTEDAGLEVVFNGSIYRDAQRGDYPPINKSPVHTTEFDLFNYDAFSQTAFSFDSSPEVQITAVNEQLIEPWTNYSSKLYGGLSTFALHVVSGAGTQDLRNTSVYITEGKRLRLLPTSLDYFGNEATSVPNDDVINAFAASAPSNSSSYTPDIFLDTVLDKTNGIGQYASLHSVDVMQLAQSKRFCQRNRLFMDGVIATSAPWREFWAQTAPFSLLELGKIGGKDTLVPALPYEKSTGKIVRAVSITALFNQGNILEDSFKEEFIDYGANVQDVIVTLVYRDAERNGIFPRNNSVEVRRTDTQESNAVRETLDISQFVSTRAQAVLLGKYLCNVRRFNRRAIEFKTFPTDIFVMPGSYVYVETSNNQWDGIYTGRIEENGILNVPVAGSIPDGSYNVLTYGSSDGTRSFTSVSVSNGIAASLAALAGQLFVLGQAVQSKRIFRVTEVTMEEEGETTIRAVEHPCDTNGLSFIAQGIDSYAAGLFTIDGQAE